MDTPKRSRFFLFGAPLLLALGIRSIAAWASHGQPVVDVASFHAWAEHLDAGRNPYTAPTWPSNYPPIWIHLCWYCLRISTWTGMSFDLVVKLLLSLSDAATALAVAWLALALGAKPTEASATAWFYAVNPVAILVAAFQAQNDPLAIGLAIWAYWLVVANPFRGSPQLAFCLLGISLGIKPVALLFLPLLLPLVPGWRRRGYCSLLCLIIATVPWIPYLFGSPTLLQDVASSYRGPPDFGYLGIYNAWENVGRGSAGLPVIESVPWWLRPFYLVVFMLVWWRFRGAGLLEQTMAVILSLYLVYGALGAQYLCWIIPFAAAARSRWLLWNTVLTAVALVAFYHLHHPGILSGAMKTKVGILTIVSIPQWVFLFLSAQLLLYVHWFRWFRALFVQTAASKES